MSTPLGSEIDRLRAELAEATSALDAAIERARLAEAQRTAQPDEDGHCTICGLPWPDERETLEPHECPPGFMQRTAAELRSQLAAERQSHEFAIDQLRGIMQSRIVAAERQLADERKAHQETSRWGNATADGLYAELDKERKGHADTRRLLELQLDVTMSEYNRAEAAKQKLADERKELEEAYKVLDDNWVTHQRVVAAEQRLKQIEAALRFLLDVVEDSCSSGYISGSGPDLAWDKRMQEAKEDAIRSLAAAQKDETT